ncbi:hypothetical protein [Planococcus sp. ISL-109]|uniref:hypothetical protein n=1 Tax=Planococcus sp. ISL-109 TaxID=2819166 RepID=UPI001BE74AE0|nr:hypothetical protein [Planococcus sp. ISL-109]MBT2582961.1 hypothetical protein [Planococcus sp. ISL-109]
MNINLTLTGGKITMVPNEEDLHQKRNYYVYEWFIKETGQVIYLGKGTGSRYKNTKRNDYFNRLFEKFECDVKKDKLENQSCHEIEPRRTRLRTTSDIREPLIRIKSRPRAAFLFL